METMPHAQSSEVKNMMQAIAKFRSALQRFKTDQLWLKETREGKERFERMIELLSSERALVFEPSLDKAMYLYGVGCLVPTKEWEAEWKLYKANPESWTPVLSHEEWDNSALQELFLHVLDVPERSVAWDKLVKTCEETIQALLRYRKLLGPDDTSEIDRISGLKISVLASTTSPHLMSMSSRALPLR
ncbi:hypothetical protein NCC49_000454 [Naganishia albida]|nr:hypothetical protein NCC49_000454 [Naganishia albida]